MSNTLFRPLVSVAAVLLFTSPGMVVANFQYNLLEAFYNYALAYECSQQTAAAYSQASYSSSGFSYLQDLQHGNSPSSAELSDHTAIINDLAIMLNAPTREALFYSGQSTYNGYIESIINQICPANFSCDNVTLVGENADIYRTISGICNNWNVPLYGSAFSSQPRFDGSIGSWERMGLINYDLTEADYLFDTKYIGVTPVFDVRPFLVKVQGDSTLRIAAFSTRGRETLRDFSCTGTCTVEGIIDSITVQGNDGNCVAIYKPYTNTFRADGSDCATKLFLIRYYVIIADIRIEPSSSSSNSTLTVDGTEIDSSSDNKFDSSTLSRYWINIVDGDNAIEISAGTEFSEYDIFLSGATLPYNNPSNILIAVGTEGSTLSTEFAIRDVYEVTTSEREGAISNYGFVNNLDSIPWVYSLYSLRFGADAPNDGQISVVLHGYSGDDVTLFIDLDNPSNSYLNATGETTAPTYDLGNLQNIDFETAADGQYKRNYGAVWIAWYDNFIFYGTGNQIALNMVTSSPLILNNLEGTFVVSSVSLFSSDFTEWVFDIEQINKPRVSSLHTGEPLPSALDVAMELLTEKGETKWSTDVTLMTFQWGQFLDHDFIATPTDSVNGHAPLCCVDGQVVNNASFSEVACFNIPVTNDLLSATELAPFDASTTECLNFVRSAHILDCSQDASTVDDRRRQQMNIITSFIDASNVYESRTNQSESLRDENSAKLKVLANPQDNQDELPLATEEGEACAVHNEVVDGVTVSCRHAGDFRSQEQMGLNGIHTLFVREHNRLVDELKGFGYTDDTSETREELFQVARHIVAAEMQVITYKNYLPSFLSDSIISEYDIEFDRNCRYSRTLDGGVRNLFGIIYRMGHTWIPNDLAGLVGVGNIFADAVYSLPLVNNFFNSTTSFLAGGTDSVMLNMHKACPLTDSKIETTVEFDLFSNVDGTSPSSSLGALNVQRGRDHGVDTYKAIRELFQLSVPQNIDQLLELGIVDENTTIALKKIYNGIEDIDAFLSGLMELPMDTTSLLGEIINHVLGAMFRLLMRGDRFWYSCYFTGNARDELKKVTIGRIMCDNIGSFDSNATQEDLFKVYDPATNDYIDCDQRESMDLSRFSKSENGGRRDAFLNNLGARETERELDLMEELLEVVEDLKNLRDEDKK